MANEGDLAGASEEFHLNLSLQNQLAQAGPSLKPMDLCHYCHSGVESDQVFCDVYCAEDYEYEKKRKQVNGR